MDNPIIESSEAEHQAAIQQELETQRKKLLLNNRMRGGIGWFFWIAGLSVINTLIFHFGGAINFVVGLGMTAIVDGFSASLAGQLFEPDATLIRIAGLAVSIGLSLLFVTAGLLGFKGYRWAVIAGMLLYALDSLIFLLARSWFGFAFHVFALWGLWSGWRAMLVIKAMQQAEPQTIISAAPSVADQAAWRQSDLIRILIRMALVYLLILVGLGVWGFILTR